jgi:hypothetical protein
VTPKVISNIGDSIEENGSPNFEMLDGLDELPDELQDKIKKAVEEGEIPVEDRTSVVSRAPSFQKICNVKLTKIFSKPDPEADKEVTDPIRLVAG